MDVILHIGAHRTASTSFQAYMRANLPALQEQGIGFWGPRRTRNGLFAGIIPTNGSPRLGRQARLAQGRIELHLDRAAAQGMRWLIVSDENIIGAPRRNLRDSDLYRGAGVRMARHAAAFGGRIARVVLSVRAFDSYWSSALAYSIARGSPLPDPAQLEAICTLRRGWRDVITELASAIPDTEIHVLPHETFAGLPDRRLQIMTTATITAPVDTNRMWLNRAADMDMLRQCLTLRGEDPARIGQGAGRYDPFTADQKARLRELYQDDLFWLASGADGLAIMNTEKTREQTGISPQRDQLTRGQDNDRQEGRVA
ncbi:MAG: hypothetical protein ACU0B7_06110 [Paracoccaceae bacterium]|uniref:hypothetical protein n=1 Tax=Seohaeicola saemankumensis TaxID=481181 RepID=UPI001E63573D|nr:hypothetical protein [Seohaeicola saemankumensis]MCD1625479.1 hypothetical protein [Seohaeicola saemankumensis]